MIGKSSEIAMSYDAGPYRSCSSLLEPCPHYCNLDVFTAWTQPLSGFFIRVLVTHICHTQTLTTCLKRLRKLKYGSIISCLLFDLLACQSCEQH